MEEAGVVTPTQEGLERRGGVGLLNPTPKGVRSLGVLSLVGWDSGLVAGTRLAWMPRWGREGEEKQVLRSSNRGGQVGARRGAGLPALMHKKRGIEG